MRVPRNHILPPVLNIIRPCRWKIVREKAGLFKGVLTAKVDGC